MLDIFPSERRCYMRYDRWGVGWMGDSRAQRSSGSRLDVSRQRRLPRDFRPFASILSQAGRLVVPVITSSICVPLVRFSPTECYTSYVLRAYERTECPDTREMNYLAAEDSMGTKRAHLCRRSADLFWTEWISRGAEERGTGPRC